MLYTINFKKLNVLFGGGSFDFSLPSNIKNIKSVIAYIPEVVKYYTIFRTYDIRNFATFSIIFNNEVDYTIINKNIEILTTTDVYNRTLTKFLAKNIKTEINKDISVNAQHKLILKTSDELKQAFLLYGSQLRSIQLDLIFDYE